jgi:arylsulfatase A-like enzyme
MMIRNYSRLLAGMVMLGGIAWSGAAEPARKPNIVVIMADDMGFSDIGSYGGEIATPNLDKLAADGLRFTQFYNMARCCPTRAALLTGLYPHQADVGHMTKSAFPLEGYRGELSKQAVTIAEALKPAGYGTYMLGKWHLSTTEKPGNWPADRGFEHYYGIISGATGYFAPTTLMRDATPISVKSDKEYQPADYYFSDALGDNAVKYLGAHCQATPEKPFFMYVAFTAPHWPLHAPAETIAKYRGKYKAGWEAIRAARLQKQLEIGLLDKAWAASDLDAPKWDSLTPEQQDEMDFRMAIYAAQVDRMDENIGKIVEELKKQNKLDDTLILFLSDNGGCAEGGVLGGGTAASLGGRGGYLLSYGKAWAGVSNTPFRLYKHFVHEGGISTPLIAHWPSGIARKGQFENQPGHLIDIMATCVDLSGAPYPKEHAGQPVPPLEGRSLVPAFAGKPIEREAIFWEHEGHRALRVGNYKLVAKGPQGKWELYDMAKDRTELHDLAAAEPERTQQMAATWESWAKRTHAIPWPWDGPNRAKDLPEKAKAKRKQAEPDKE